MRHAKRAPRHISGRRITFGRVWTAINQPDRQPCTNALQCRRPISGAVIDDQHLGHTAFEQGLLEYALDVDRALREAERAMGDEPRGVVHQRDQVGLAAPPAKRQVRAMQDIAVPDGAGVFGHEAALLLGQDWPSQRCARARGLAAADERRSARACRAPRYRRTSSSRRIWRIERRGFSRLAARIATLHRLGQLRLPTIDTGLASHRPASPLRFQA